MWYPTDDDSWGKRTKPRMTPVVELKGCGPTYGRQHTARDTSVTREGMSLRRLWGRASSEGWEEILGWICRPGWLPDRGEDLGQREKGQAKPYEAKDKENWQSRLWRLRSLRLEETQERAGQTSGVSQTTEGTGSAAQPETRGLKRKPSWGELGVTDQAKQSNWNKPLMARLAYLRSPQRALYGVSPHSLTVSLYSWWGLSDDPH